MPHRIHARASDAPSPVAAASGSRHTLRQRLDSKFTEIWKECSDEGVGPLFEWINFLQNDCSEWLFELPPSGSGENSSRVLTLEFEPARVGPPTPHRPLARSAIPPVASSSLDAEAEAAAAVLELSSNNNSKKGGPSNSGESESEVNQTLAKSVPANKQAPSLLAGTPPAGAKREYQYLELLVILDEIRAFDEQQAQAKWEAAEHE